MTTRRFDGLCDTPAAQVVLDREDLLVDGPLKALEEGGQVGRVVSGVHGANKVGRPVAGATGRRRPASAGPETGRGWRGT